MGRESTLLATFGILVCCCVPINAVCRAERVQSCKQGAERAVPLPETPRGGTLKRMWDSGARTELLVMLRPSQHQWLHQFAQQYSNARLLISRSAGLDNNSQPPTPEKPTRLLKTATRGHTQLFDCCCEAVRVARRQSCTQGPLRLESPLTGQSVPANHWHAEHHACTRKGKGTLLAVLSLTCCGGMEMGAACGALAGSAL